jgi:Fe2+ transport system protein FeoA
MSAEKIKKNPLTKTTPKQAAIIATNSQHPDLSLTDIAKLTKTDKSHVKRTLEQFGIIKELTDTYVNQRARIYQGVQAKIISSITTEDIQKASLKDKCVAMGIVHDHERVELGQSNNDQPILVVIQGGNVSISGGAGTQVPVEQGQIVDITQSQESSTM